MRWKLGLGVVLAGRMLTMLWLYHNRSEAVYDRIINQQGYSLALVKEGISAEFFLRPEWIPEQNGEETVLNRVILDQFDTEVVLEKVQRRERDFFINIAQDTPVFYKRGRNGRPALAGM
ncbi:hypothetical protein, partial [Paenibacillus sp. PL2-23]